VTRGAVVVAIVRNAGTRTVPRIADLDGALAAVIGTLLDLTEAETSELARRVRHARPEERIRAGRVDGLRLNGHARTQLARRADDTIARDGARGARGPIGFVRSFAAPIRLAGIDGRALVAVVARLLRPDCACQCNVSTGKQQRNEQSVGEGGHVVPREHRPH
jgi:hypothetical protein